MKEFAVLHQYAEEFERLLRLRTFPLAVKLLQREEDIPEGAQRPLRDFGYHLSLCQAFSRLRTVGTNIYGGATEGVSPSSPAIAMLKEDMWCPEPVIGYGLAEPPQYFFDGYRADLAIFRTPEAARNWAQAFPHLEPGKYIGIVASPLKATNFEPDLVVTYCNSAQISLLITASTWKGGEAYFPSKLHPSAACVRAIVPVIQEGKCVVALPCWGDRVRAMARDDELIFSAPTGKLEELLLGLRAFEQTGRKMPPQLGVFPEHELPDEYVKLGKAMGMEWLKS